MRKMVAVIILALLLTGCNTPTRVISDNDPGIWTKVYGPGTVTRVNADGASVIKTWCELFVVTPDFETYVGQKVNVYIHFLHGSDEWAVVNVILAQ